MNVSLVMMMMMDLPESCSSIIHVLCCIFPFASSDYLITSDVK